MVLRVRTLSREEHVAFVEKHATDKNAATSVSFLQCPSWGDLKTDWRPESIGWIDAHRFLFADRFTKWR